MFWCLLSSGLSSIIFIWEIFKIWNSFFSTIFVVFYIDSVWMCMCRLLVSWSLKYSLLLGHKACHYETTVGWSCLLYTLEFHYNLIGHTTLVGGCNCFGIPEFNFNVRQWHLVVAQPQIWMLGILSVVQSCSLILLSAWSTITSIRALQGHFREQLSHQLISLTKVAALKDHCFFFHQNSRNYPPIHYILTAA